MTPEYGQLVFFLLGLFGVGFFIWMAQNSARKRGEAEANLQAEREARKAEQEMTDIVLTPREAGETEKRLDDGTF